MKRIKVTLIIILGTLSSLSFAQYTEVINSNRPGISESAFSVGTNVAQAEIGAFIVNEEHTPLNYEVAGLV